ncbi:MAG TPA: HDOD domain-containing protein [Bryobacteraceae bacterium]|nr:HDOD domain-containing protein [Bryobacteraceae bacterium]
MRDRALRALDRLPPFSPILNRLVATMARDDASLIEFAELIEKDAVLAGNLLRVVNSALYSLQGTVSSVRHAVAVLGLIKLRKLALSISVARMWTQAQAPAGEDPARFNAHSVASGVLSDLIAGGGHVDYPEGAFVAGLLHDVGKLLIATADPEGYAQVCREAQQEGRNWVECESGLLGITHAELSGAALERWNLPAPIREAVARHHEPDAAGCLSTVVRAADAAANALGHSIIPRAPEPVAGDVMPLLDHFELEFGAMRRFFC